MWSDWGQIKCASESVCLQELSEAKFYFSTIKMNVESALEKALHELSYGSIRDFQ